MKTENLIKILSEKHLDQSIENTKYIIEYVNVFINQNYDNLEQADIYFIKNNLSRLHKILKSKSLQQNYFMFREEYNNAISLINIRLRSLN